MPRYSEDELRQAIQISDGYAGALRILGLCQTGGNNEVMKRWIREWDIDTAHFLSPSERSRRNPLVRNKPTPVEQYLVAGRLVNGNHLKRKLYLAGLKNPWCELCGQGVIWNGKKMSLVLDHINGVHDDNRLENLRIVCPNCNATLDTHCGRKIKVSRGKPGNPHKGIARINRRKVERPSYEQLIQDLGESNYSAVGRKYGVTDNAIRKWKRFYEENQP